VTTGRERIVSALGTVAQLSAYPSAPDNPVAGDAWPVWVMGRYAGKLGLTLVNDYDVLAILPAGYAATTVETGDGLLWPLSSALAKVATLVTAEPVAIQVGSSTMPGLRIRCTPRDTT
jgi:hypothetical protein